MVTGLLVALLLPRQWLRTAMLATFIGIGLAKELMVTGWNRLTLPCSAAWR